MTETLLVMLLELFLWKGNKLGRVSFEFRPLDWN